MPASQKVLFLCTGNSCRSQMAEGLLRHFYRDRNEAYSAGINPTDLNPYAVRVMHEVGIDISHQRSKSVDEFLNRELDTVITVCDHAKESCPLFPGNVKRLHWGFRDPAEAKGDEESVLSVFRKVRDQIRTSIDNEFGEKGQKEDAH